jgi:hypothetical protein
MPRYWVKDYFKPILMDASEAWMQGKSKGAVTTRSEIVKAVSEQIQTAVTERNDPVPHELEKVCIYTQSRHFAHVPPL